MLRHLFASSILLLSAALPAAAQPAPASTDGPVVVTAGEGVVKRAPDRAWVSIAAESRAKSPREAQRSNADAMAAVLTKLKGLGLATDAIRTSGYDLQPDFDYANGKQTLRGYVARNTVEVRVDELARVGEIVDAAVGSGATSVSGIRFDLKDRAGDEREALRRAVVDARGRADAAAQGAGLRVERVVRIEEQRGIGQEPPRPMIMMRQMAGPEAAQTPIAPGDLEVRAVVTMTATIR